MPDADRGTIRIRGACQNNLKNLDLDLRLVDLGPEGGARGGRIVAAGPPEALARAAARSHTGRHLRDFMAVRGA